MKVYLDNCCFNRPYDDQSRLRIRLEAEAKMRIQEEIRNGIFKLVWSYILDYENSKNPFRERKEQITKWRMYAVEDIAENEEVLDVAKILQGHRIKKYRLAAHRKRHQCRSRLLSDNGCRNSEEGHACPTHPYH